MKQTNEHGFTCISSHIVSEVDIKLNSHTNTDSFDPMAGLPAFSKW